MMGSTLDAKASAAFRFVAMPFACASGRLVDHLRVFANPVAADEWFKEGAAFDMRSWSEARPRSTGRRNTLS
jgi:hypothetical protein